MPDPVSRFNRVRASEVPRFLNISPSSNFSVDSYMKVLITKSEILQKKARDLIPCECYYCKKPFTVTKNTVLRGFKGSKNVKFCSRTCSYIASSFRVISVSCKNCNVSFSKKERNPQVFCSQRCSAIYNNNLREYLKPPRKYNSCLNCKSDCIKKFCSRGCHVLYCFNRKIQLWKNGELKGYSGTSIKLIQSIRRFLFKKYGNKCAECGWGKTNLFTNRIPLEVHHIDGNSKNCKEENLLLLCPSCHSLTNNFRSRNKQNSRKHR